jgi:CRP/FNR family transcriptional regulator, cyclic AMP receptor protein
MSIELATCEKRTVEFWPPINSGAKARTSHPSPTAERDPARAATGNSFFSGLSEPSIRAINQITRVTRRPKGAVVFFEEDAARGVYLLHEGRANVLTAISDGRTLVLRVAQPGDVLGLNSVLAGTSHTVTVETLQPCRFTFIARGDFLKLIEEHSDACLYFAQCLGQDCQSAYDVIRSMASPVPVRLARFLVSCCGNESAEEGILRVKLSLTREAIAQRIGCTRETVSRTLSSFKKGGVVELVGTTLIVHNPTALQSLSASW